LKVPGPEEQVVDTDDAIPAAGTIRGRDDGAKSAKGSGSPLPSFMEEIAAAIPDDLATLRPEDIRVEAEFADLVVTTGAPPASIAPPPAEPVPEIAPATTVPSPPRSVPQPPPPVPAPAVPTTAAVVPTPAQPVDVGVGSPLPAITIEPPSILPREREYKTVQEVILQPATVLAWSLLVLMALPMAFVAGLLIGHFVWR
jgi:hypothetical protein